MLQVLNKLIQSGGRNADVEFVGDSMPAQSFGNGFPIVPESLVDYCISLGSETRQTF